MRGCGVAVLRCCGDASRWNWPEIYCLFPRQGNSSGYPSGVLAGADLQEQMVDAAELLLPLHAPRPTGCMHSKISQHSRM